MERPNTVSGLIDKRRELMARLKIARTDVQRLTTDIDAIDTVIRLFAPEVDGRGAKAKRLPSPFAARKGEMQRTILDAIREADGPVTSLEVAERFCASRGLAPDDRTLNTVRNRVSGILGKMRAKGVIADVPLVGQYKGWVISG